MLIYSAGLRVGEVVKLRIEDIDVRRKLIRIKGGKGRKDRYTILSEIALKTLREYVENISQKNGYFRGREKTGTSTRGLYRRSLRMHIREE